MKVNLEMTNGKKYKVDYPDNLDMFLEHVEFEDANGFLLTTDGTYVNIRKIVEFKPE